MYQKTLGKRIADRDIQSRSGVIAQNVRIFDICKYLDMYVDKLRIRIKNEFWNHFASSKHLQ